MTQRTDGIETIEQAWAAAKLEEQAAPADAGVGAPPSLEPPEPPIEGDQPSGADPELQALVDSLSEQPQPEDGSLPISDPAFWQQATEIDGEQVTLAQMRAGFMKDADYTKKTQEVAEQRRSNEDAIKLYEQLVADPQEFSRALAVEYGWVDPTTTTPVVEVELPAQLNPEALDARLDELVAERMASDPRFLEAEQVRARQLVADEWTRIESDMRIAVPSELRDSIMAEAAEKQIYDFEILLKARLANVGGRTPDATIRPGAARPRSAGGLGTNHQEPVANPTTIAEAWQQAKAEAGL